MINIKTPPKEKISDIGSKISEDVSSEIELKNPKNNEEVKNIIHKLENDINNFYYQINMATIVKHGLKNADDIIKKSDGDAVNGGAVNGGTNGGTNGGDTDGGDADGDTDTIKNMSSNVDGGHKVNFQKLANSYNLFLNYTYVTPRGKCKKLSIKNPFATKTKNMKIETLKILAESMQNFITYCKKKIDATEKLLNSYKNLYKLNHVSKITQEKAENTIEKAKKATEKAKNAAAAAATYATNKLTIARNTYKTENESIGKLNVYNYDSFKEALNSIQRQLYKQNKVK